MLIFTAPADKLKLKMRSVYPQCVWRLLGKAHNFMIVFNSHIFHQWRSWATIFDKAKTYYSAST